MNIFGYTVMLAAACAPVFAALPVVAGKDQAAMLKSSDPKLEKNKRVAYDFFRVVLKGFRLDQADTYMTTDYMQHNPNAETGMVGFKAYFNAIMPKQLPPVPATLDGLVAIQAEGDYVTLSFVREYDDPAAKGKKYTTTWFDMFRIVNGKIVEHWDSATKGATGPVAAGATKK
jgi:predicted SnoaL-like aldol condensation-catalyzing enzyme